MDSHMELAEYDEVFGFGLDDDLSVYSEEEMGKLNKFLRMNIRYLSKVEILEAAGGDTDSVDPAWIYLGDSSDVSEDSSFFNAFHVDNIDPDEEELTQDDRTALEEQGFQIILKYNEEDNMFQVIRERYCNPIRVDILRDNITSYSELMDVVSDFARCKCYDCNQKPF